MNFGSYLDKQRMHRNAMRKTAFQRTLARGQAMLVDRTLVWKINSADVFRFSPNYKKSQIYR